MLGTCVCLREPKREALCRERFCRREERGESSTLRMLVKCMTTAFIGLTPMKMRATIGVRALPQVLASREATRASLRHMGLALTLALAGLWIGIW